MSDTVINEEKSGTLSAPHANPTFKLDQIYRDNEFVLSYELFPPKTDKGMETLRKNLGKLLKYRPNFITCTYGALGHTRDKTLATLKLVREICDLPIASHLTCVAATVDDLREYLQRAADQGINYIVAIRGDAPKGDTEFKPVEGGLSYANELIALIRDEFPNFGIAAGGYPETHPEAPNPEVDLQNLKRKVDTGVDVIITQMFYDNEDFYRWRDRCRAAGIDVPIVPGVMPIISYKQIAKIASMCGATLPRKLTDKLEACGEDQEAQFQVGVNHCIDQVRDLVERGIPGLHFYVLNKARATAQVLEAVNIPEHHPSAT